METALQRLYRVQLRTARYFDANPALKALLCMPGVNLLGGSSPTAAAANVVAQRWRTQSGGLYQPTSSLYDFVRAQYAEPLVVDAGSADSTADSVFWRRLDTAFNLQRALVFIADAAAQVSQAREHSQAVDAVPSIPAGRGLREADALSPGCLLVEHPSILRPGRGLIFVYDISQNVRDLHGNEDWAVRGYVVNRPFPHTVAAITENTRLGRFGGLSMFHGGGEDDKLSVVHSVKGVPGATAVDDSDDSLFVGGDVAVLNEAIELGRATECDVKAVLGSIVLPLRKDADSGALELVDAERFAFVSGPAVRDIVLHPPIRPSEKDAALLPKEAGKGYDYARFWHQNVVWRMAVRLLADGMDPQGCSPSWQEVRSFADLHAATCAVIAAALPLPYRSMDAPVVAASAGEAGAARREAQHEQPHRSEDGLR